MPVKKTSENIPIFEINKHICTEPMDCETDTGNTFKEGSVNTMEVDFEIPSNQEALSKIDALDLTIRLSDINPTQYKTTENGLCIIAQVLRDRLEFSKKRESLIHGNRTGRYPSWNGVNTKCFLNLPNKQEDEKFRGFWKELTNAIQKQASQKVIDFLGNQIKEKENEANRIKTKTIRKIGFATQESFSIRTQLDKDVLQLHEENTKELEEFRKHLNSMQQNSPSTSKSAPLSRTPGKPPHFPRKDRNYHNRRTTGPAYRPQENKSYFKGRSYPY